MANCLRQLWRWRRQLFAVMTPLLLLPLPLCLQTKVAKGGYVLLLMGCYWCTEVIPLPVTSLLPVIIVPVLGITSTADVVTNYSKDLVVMILGSFIVALAVEKCDLHKRVALKILLLVGTQPAWLLLGFMSASWLMSLCMCNTATVATLLPVLEAVLKHIEQPSNTKQQDDTEVFDSSMADNSEHRPEDTKTSTESTKNGVRVVFSERRHKRYGSIECCDIEIDKSNEVGPAQQGSKNSSRPNVDKETASAQSNMAKALTLSISYGANIGGVATLTGALPNMIMKDHSDVLYEDHGLESPVTFASWIVYGLPLSLIMFVGTWAWINAFHMGPRSLNLCRKDNSNGRTVIQDAIADEYKALGKTSFRQVVVGLLWLLLILLWFFRSPGFMPGWEILFEPGYIGKSVPAVLVVAALFIIPAKLTCKCTETSSENAELSVPLNAKPTQVTCNEVHTPGKTYRDLHSPPEVLMDWTTVSRRLPWGMLLLTGGGFAVAQATVKSGLADWLASQLSVLDALPDWLTLVILCLVVTLLTEIVSTPAAAALLIPLVAPMAESMGKSPLYLMFPVAVSTLFAFMLPVGSPPNSVAFSFGRIKIIDMVKTGSLVNVLGVLVAAMATLTWGMTYFDLDTLPWATNATMSQEAVNVLSHIKH